MFAKDFSKMEAVCQILYGHGQEQGASEQRPYNELPVIEAGPVFYTQDDQSFEWRVKIVEIVPDSPEMEVPSSLFQRFIFFEKGLHAFVVYFRRIDTMSTSL